MLSIYCFLQTGCAALYKGCAEDNKVVICHGRGLRISLRAARERLHTYTLPSLDPTLRKGADAARTIACVRNKLTKRLLSQTNRSYHLCHLILKLNELNVHGVQHENPVPPPVGTTTVTVTVTQYANRSLTPCSAGA
jgi:hypothetical protein